MQQEAADEFGRGQRHLSALAAAPVVAPVEAHTAVAGGEQAVVGDGHAVGVVPEAGEDLGRAGEGRLEVDHPLGLAQWSKAPESVRAPSKPPKRGFAWWKALRR